MDIEKILTEGLILKKGKEAAASGKKKPTLATYLKGTHGSASAKKKAEYKLKRAKRNKK